MITEWAWVFLIHNVWIKMFSQCCAMKCFIAVMILTQFFENWLFFSLKNAPIKGLYQGQPKYGVPVFNPREENDGRLEYFMWSINNIVKLLELLYMWRVRKPLNSLSQRQSFKYIEPPVLFKLIVLRVFRFLVIAKFPWNWFGFSMSISVSFEFLFYGWV